MAAHLALLAVSPLFLFPFCEHGDTAVVVLWLSAFAVLWVFMEPSRHADEMLHDARARVAREVVRGPVFWVLGVLTVLAALRWINSGIELAFDTENMRWYMREPLFSALPGALSGLGKYEFSLALATWIIVVGIRHSLGKQARLSFVVSSSCLAGIAAMIAVSAAALGTPVAMKAAKAVFDKPSFPGALFAVYALVSVVALAGVLEAKWNRIAWIPALAVGGTFAAAFTFSPSVSVMLYAIAAVLTAFISMGWLGAASRGSSAMRFFAIFLIGVGFAFVLAICVTPEAIVQSRMAEIQSLSLFPKDFPEVRATLSKIAMKSWDGAKWLGSGLGTFSSQMRFVADKADWRVITQARPAAYSAWWTLMAERGLIGAMMLAVPLGFLFFTLFRRIPGIFGNRFFLPGCWLGLAILAVAVTESFYDVSFLRSEALLAIAAFMAISAGSLPPLKKKSAPSDTGDDD